MMFGKKKIQELEKRVEALEKELNELLRPREAKESSHTQKDQQNEAVTVAQVLDEWLNGKKEGGK